ncbi:MAG TPA: acetylxylan esterase [Fibrobacteres bacterium]|jgi:hypothetical protein|nr:acetylxylan esterase [Fibrobacterota bacterium]
MRYAWGFLFLAATAFGQNLNCVTQTTNESQVNTYTLPNVLQMQNGTPVTTADQWTTQRRPELMELFANYEYGRSPGRPANMTFQIHDNNPSALNGKATRKQVTIYFTSQTSGPKLDLLIYLPNKALYPKAVSPIPVFLGINFWGNEMINADTGITLNTNYVETGLSSYNPSLTSCVQNHRATATCRGSNSAQFPMDSLFNHGYGLATFARNDIDPDTLMTSSSAAAVTAAFKTGVYALYQDLEGGRGDNFTAIGAWAWGLSRAMDYLETDTSVDSKRVMVFGWSRMGKTAVWAGAQDPRFAMVISDESGAGGVALAKRLFGEDVCRLVTHFPHWFAKNFNTYSNNETNLPFDQHELVAAIAPRPLYASSAQNDLNSDPKGEFLGVKAADPVYRLLGQDTLPAVTWPAYNQPVFGGQTGYHVRTGNHDLTAYDWSQYLRFADLRLKPVSTSVKPIRKSLRLSGSDAAVYSIDGKWLPQVRGSALHVGIRIRREGNRAVLYALPETP